MACKVLHDSRLIVSYQARVPGQDAGKYLEHGYCRLLQHVHAEKVFYPCACGHGATVLAYV